MLFFLVTQARGVLFSAETQTDRVSVILENQRRRQRLGEQSKVPPMIGGGEFEPRCLIPKTLPTVSWGSGPVSWICPLNTGQTLSPGRKAVVNICLTKPPRPSGCRSHRGHPPWAVAAGIPSTCSGMFARGGTNVPCLCAGGGLLSSFVLKLPVGGD